MRVKGETGSVTKLSWECSIMEKNIRRYLMPMRHFYCVLFLNTDVKSFIIFQQWKRFFFKFLIRWTQHVNNNRLRKIMKIIEYKLLKLILKYCRFMQGYLLVVLFIFIVKTIFWRNLREKNHRNSKENDNNEIIDSITVLLWLSSILSFKRFVSKGQISLIKKITCFVRVNK